MAGGVVLCRTKRKKARTPVRKILDKSEKGELWMEITAGLTVYHVEGPDGFHLAVTNPREAKRAWEKVNRETPRSLRG